jgi:hypothetical protein
MGSTRSRREARRTASQGGARFYELCRTLGGACPDDRASEPGSRPSGGPARGPIENRFDPPAKPSRRLRLRLPDRLRGLHHEHDIDRLHGQRTENRARVGIQSVGPPVLVFRVFPAALWASI